MILSLLMLFCSSQSSNRIFLRTLRAFPTAEGAGALATGGRNSTIIYVTTLEDTGQEGSLRWALSRDYPRLVYFLIGGLFEVPDGRFEIRYGDLTLAGETAIQLGGVHLAGYLFIYNVDNLIIRYIDVKGGWDSDRDAIGVSRAYNAIFDHVTAGWHGDEAFSITNPCTNVDPPEAGNITVQRCLVHEGMYGHNVGTLSGILYSHANTQANPYEVWNQVGSFSYHHNCYIGVTHRQVNADTGINGKIRQVNNVVYFFGSRITCLGGIGKHDLVNNYYRQGRVWGVYRSNLHRYQVNVNLIEPWTVVLDPSIHVAGNIVAFNDNTKFLNESESQFFTVQFFQSADVNLTNPTTGVKKFYPYGERYYLEDEGYFHREEPIEPDEVPITVHSAEDAFFNVLNNCGANVRFNDDETGSSYYATEVDREYISWAVNGTGPTVKTELGNTANFDYGRNSYTSLSISIDDVEAGYTNGVPDEWEVPENIVNLAGFSRLELYLAELAFDFVGANAEISNEGDPNESNDDGEGEIADAKKVWIPLSIVGIVFCLFFLGVTLGIIIFGVLWKKKNDHEDEIELDKN